MKTETKCFLIVDDVDVMEDTSDGAYGRGVASMFVEGVDVRPVEVFKDDVLEAIVETVDVVLLGWDR